MRYLLNTYGSAEKDGGGVAEGDVANGNKDGQEEEAAEHPLQEDLVPGGGRSHPIGPGFQKVQRHHGHLSHGPIKDIFGNKEKTPVVNHYLIKRRLQKLSSGAMIFWTTLAAVNVHPAKITRATPERGL